MATVDNISTPAPRIAVFACEALTPRLPGIWHSATKRPAVMEHATVSLSLTCLARLHPGALQEAFLSGHDGILILACLVKECFNCHSDVQALRGIHRNAHLVNRLGLYPGRLRQEWLGLESAGEVAAICRDFANDLRKLGPAERGENNQAGDGAELAGRG